MRTAQLWFPLQIVIFLKSIFVHDVDLKLSESDVSPTMKIHEMGWNKVPKTNTIYDCIWSRKCKSHMWLQIVEHDLSV
jgi:hypothetical protein